MATPNTIFHQPNSHSSLTYYYTTSDDDEDNIIIDSDMDENEEHDNNQNTQHTKNTDTNVATWWCLPVAATTVRKFLSDPKWVEEWNRVFLLVCAAGLFVDPLFFYALSISDTGMCLFVDGWFAVTVTVLKCMTDTLHLWNMWLQMKMKKRWFSLVGDGESGDYSSTHGNVAVSYLKRGFFFDLFVILPMPQAAGACWYLLGIQRAVECLEEQCGKTSGCGLKTLSCKQPIYYGTTTMVRDKTRLMWAKNTEARSTCLDDPNNYEYGFYEWVVQLVTNDSRMEKILFPIFWGLMTLSTFGNLQSTTEWLEVVFSIIVLISGLLLVTMLIGNIKVFLNATTSKKQVMKSRMRNIEWWMRKRQLPQGFRQRVHNYEWQRWAAMRGVDESQLIQDLPEGLRRDIKYHLCLDLVRQISREGDPVQRMLFVVRGHLQSSQVLRDGVKSCCMLGPGNFSGDELLSWCLRRPFIEKLPPSSSTLVTLETTEAFGLEANDVKYVTQHFRYIFMKEKVKRSARYYSPGWRTWASVAIQLAWRRYKHRLSLNSLSFIRPRRPISRSSSMEEDRLRLYTALLTSAKPNQDDFELCD
ncbi:unnamed protein product [Lupinus luteus]|uniref:Uncharacterized protein n=1 Tax=Lupinus luteus TaxID=3873 RepID=A0AAV1WP87_LUPLU